MSRLLITCRDKSSVERHYLPALRRGGWEGSVFLVAPGDPLPAPETYGGLLLPGGDDIHPGRWDAAEPVHPLAEPDPDRDALEIPLVREAWERGLPILGICRGEQVLNVALGGSLIQDIPSHYHCEPDRHRLGSPDIPQLAHRVSLDPASRLRTLVRRDEVEVNSRHHQAVGRLAEVLRAVAWHPATALNGTPLVEGVEARDGVRWVVGVQWHPENLVAMEDPAAESALGIFQGFAAALRGRA